MYNNDNTYNRMLEMTLTQRMYCKMFRALKKKLIHFNLFDFFKILCLFVVSWDGF